MIRLRQHEGVGALALEFAILCASRSGEVGGATWGEIDMNSKEWSIPATRMKMKKEHCVPLSDAALTVLRGWSAATLMHWCFQHRRAGHFPT